MRKPVFRGILRLLLLYCGIFVVLVIVQFARGGGFTQKAGSLVVSGHYRTRGEHDPPTAANEYLLGGDTHVFFGGMDFGLAEGKNDRSLRLILEDGTKEETLPERMIVSGDSVRFVFLGEVELEFTTRHTGGSQEMRIFGVFPEGAAGMELPFGPLKKTEIHETGNGSFIASSDGINYSFGRSPMDTGRRMLIIRADETAVSYRAIPGKRILSPEDFILPEAQTAGAYLQELTRWRDQNFAVWNRIVSQQNDEDLAMAYIGEALVRGSYGTAAAAVPSAFLRGTRRTYESSVYLGGLDSAYRSLAAADREKLARLSRQINEKSLEFLLEPGVFDYLNVRGQQSVINAGAELARSMDSAALTLELAPGILEGYLSWKAIRPSAANPFEQLADPACSVVLECLRLAEDGSRVFAFNGDQGDTEFNLRLGKALLAYAETAQNAVMAGIGRSLVLSALSMGEPSGLAIAGMFVSENGEINESPDRLTSARLHRILNPVEPYPRALAVGAPANNMWAWTTAQALSASLQNDILDITVRFPTGETHYMIIRGMRPFVRIQLYDMDFRSDPQFERYDSSGWVYYAQEQTLVLKMRHRAAEERIRIIYREEVRPEPEPEPEPAAEPPPPVVNYTETYLYYN